MQNINSLLQVDNRENYSMIRFFGFIDAATVEKIKPVIQLKIPEDCKNILIDLKMVDFLDSHGVGLFASLLKKAHRNNGKLVFAEATAQPASILKMVGFNNSLVTYCDSLKDASSIFETQ